MMFDKPCRYEITTAGEADLMLLTVRVLTVSVVVLAGEIITPLGGFDKLVNLCRYKYSACHNRHTTVDVEHMTRSSQLEEQRSLSRHVHHNPTTIQQQTNLACASLACIAD